MKVNDIDKAAFQIAVIDDDHGFKGWGYRHQQCLILFFCLTTALSLRACMGVALVAMVDNDVGQAASAGSDNASVDAVIAAKLSRADTNVTTDKDNVDNDTSGVLHSLLLIPPYPTFQWNKKTQDTVLASFYWGYMLLQIPAGQLAHRFGARYLLTGALLINCVLCICLPWAAFYGGWVLTSVFRVVKGLSQACVIPGVHTMLGQWAPLEERGRLAGFAYGGSVLGTVLGLTVPGFIAASPLGWPGIFRFYGALSGVVGCAMWLCGADSPARHATISAGERNYIEQKLGHSGKNGKKKQPVPWSHILRSRGLWAIVIAHIGQTWGQLTFYTEVPAFMDKVMGVSIKANGVLTAFPYLVMWFANFFYTWFTDMLIVKKVLSVANTRKLANSIGSVIPAIGFVVLAYVPKDIYIVETVLVIICVFKVACNVGFHINHIDISNNYSGTLISISNFASNMFGSLAPIVAGSILTDVKSDYLWRKVFYVSAGLYFFTNLFYVIFGEGDKAEWDDVPEDKHETDKKDVSETEAMIKENSVAPH